MPHPEWGEQLRAAWVPRGNAGGGDRDQAAPSGDRAEPDRDEAEPDRDEAAPDGPALRAWGKERLAPYKVPHVFARVAALPRNAMGKVRKTAVRRMLTEPEADAEASRPSGRAAPPPGHARDPHNPRPGDALD